MAKLDLIEGIGPMYMAKLNKLKLGSKKPSPFPA
jgi:hypothetical protein